MNQKARNLTGYLWILLIAVALVLILCLLLSSTPLKTMSLFFFGPLRNVYNFGNMLNYTTVMIFGGLAVSIAMKGGSYNLGGEGQIYLGGFIATLTALALGGTALFSSKAGGAAGAIISILAGMLASGILSGFSGWCRMRLNTSEMITSFLLSSAVVMVVNYMITGPFMDTTSNLLTTSKIPESMWLARILPPSNLSTSIVIALIMVACISFWLRGTRSGYAMRMTGMSSRFAVYCGLNTKLHTWLPMFFSGALYGLGGALSVFGTYHASLRDFQSGLGWNGFAVALIARFEPRAVIPAALLFAWIESGSRIAMQGSDVTSKIAAIVQASIFFLASCSIFQEERHIRQGGLKCKC
ncbi:MAG: ABC transporter permease [Sphaerochaetaceae bacterium]|jgi:riboflavin transport system permease protein|nr:ABC transporter permease [Sphaerochaetaceae bacterium]NLY07575.1 ABC transporter permease [Spirochaetales bacterium]